MNSEFVAEKRKEPRFQISIPVSCRGIDNRQAISHTFDISGNGIGLISDTELPLGEAIEICLHMADNGETVCFHGKVIWMMVYGQGRYRAGIMVEPEHIKPIPLVLRTLQSQIRHFN